MQRRFVVARGVFFWRTLFSTSNSKSLLRRQIEQDIKDNAVMVYSKSYCPYCDSVKELFEALQVKYNAKELDLIADGSLIQAELRKITDQSTVPNVFVNGVHIGGASDTFTAHNNGTLQHLLDQKKP
eukprot:TRINITY_DN2996_c0_g1_i1.p1 TRINITY_DN2996_c0_g1~~TRINITY_DN2996_c0_g1_i1.p1  ORF type:complete len:127 (-),score=31.87 TRINITY_DN2996_c0_g1_i1:37-417(-)